MTDWKKISDYQGYEINERGDIRNISTQKILKPIKSNNGYSHVTLCDDKGHHQKLIHRLVAKEFVINQNPSLYDQVNHLDGNKSNNKASNLEWVNHSGNMKHAYSTGLQKPIEQQIKYSLSRASEVKRTPVCNIKTGAEYNSVIECSKAEGLSRSAVSMHLTGRTKKQRYAYIDKKEVGV